MLPDQIRFSIWTNNLFLEEYLLDQKSHKVVYTKKRPQSNYHLFLIDLDRDLTNISQVLTEAYRYCRENKQKLTVVLLHGRYLDQEKNLYFEDLLKSLGQDTPLHRLVIVPCLLLIDSPQANLWLNQFLDQSLKTQHLEVSKKGNLMITPLSYPDFEEALLKIFFLSGTAGNKYYLSGSPISDLEVAYLVKKYLQDNLQIDLDIGNLEIEKVPENYNSLSLQTQAKLGWEPKIDSDQLITQYLKIHSVEKIDLKDSNPKSRPIFKKLHRLIARFTQNRQKIAEIKPHTLLKKILEEIIAGIIFVYLIISLTFIFSLYTSLKSLETSLYYLKKGDLQNTTKNLTKSEKYLRVGEFNYQFLSSAINFFSPDQAQKSQNLLSFVNYSEMALQSLVQTYNLSEKIYFSIGNNNQSLNYEEVTLALKSNLQLTFENISQIEATLSQGKLPKIVEESVQKNLEYSSLKNLQDQLTQLSKIVNLIPPTLSGEIGKNIVVVFQNTDEERATGGVIESILYLTLDHGRFVDKKIYTSTDLDTKNSDPTPPPPLVQSIIGLDVWKTRDLNYNPDFPQTAINLGWQIEKSLKFKPDIIIFVTESIFSGLVDTNNLYFPKLVDDLTNKIINHQLSFLSLSKTLAQAMGESQILFWTADSESEKSLLSQNYSGSVRSRDCHPGIQTARLCLSQTTHLSISNFSAIPLNSYLNHQIKHLVYLEPKSIRHQYLIDYSYEKNTSLLNRNLVEIYQLYVPQGSILRSVTIDSQPLGLSGFAPQSEVGLDRYQFPVSTFLNSKHLVVIDFDFPLEEVVKLPIAYSFTEIRQPGSHADGVTLEINHPLSIRPSIITSEVTTKAGKIIYQFPRKNATFGVHFVPNQVQ